MKFNTIISNPPYQAPTKPSKSKKGKVGTSIWDKFVELSLKHTKDDGYVCNIHPGRWRSPKSKIGAVIKKKQMLYLEMHGIKDGMKIFGCYTDYDWYVLKNKINDSKTKIVDRNGTISNYNINTMPFIPIANIKEVMKLVAVNGEEKVEVLYDCRYHTQARFKDGTMNKEKTSEFKYPCVWYVGLNLGLRYSSVNRGHFGIPKVIWGDVHSRVLIDYKGEYGLTQFAYAIVDDVENLDNIAKALNSKRFIDDLMNYHAAGFANKYDYKIIATFRKDWWKEFI